MKNRRNKWVTLILVMILTCCTLTACSGDGNLQEDEGTDSLVAMVSSETLEATEESEDSVAEETVSVETEVETEAGTGELQVIEESVPDAEEMKELIIEEAVASSVELIPNPPPQSIPEPVPQLTSESAPQTTSAHESITKPSRPAEHVHTLVEEVKAATCDSAKEITTKCSTCSYVEGTVIKGKALVHDFVESWLYEPTCTGDGYKIVKCSRCGEEGSGSGDVAPKGHDFKSKVKVEGDCKTPQLIVKTCKVCGAEETVEDKDAHADDHVWITGTVQVWSDEEFAMVDVERTCCSVCGIDKP